MNPINYARGLLDELETAVRTGDKKLEDEVRGELEKLEGEVREAIAELRGLVDPKTVKNARGEEVKTTAVADIQAVGERLDAALGKGRGGPRTAKAASAPEKAVPPSAK